MVQHTLSTIEELQAAIGRAIDLIPQLSSEGRLPPEIDALKYLAPPEELAAKVSMRHVENDRQIKSSASSGSWVPGACGVWVEYTIIPDSTPTLEQVEPKERALVFELDAAERTPRRNFVAWTWFRDKYLTAPRWKYGKGETQKCIQSLVERSWIESKKVENPTNPAFPTATLSLNRQHPDVRRLLEIGGAAARFAPVPIKGEALSESIVRDRR